MIVVLDTNVWRKEMLLRTVTGVAFLYALRQVGGKLLLPDTTRREIIAIVAQAGADAVRKIEHELGTVQQLTGSRPGMALPPEDAFRQSAMARLDEISDLLLPVVVLERHLRNALDRVLDHRPPSAGKNEQYRDCILWECILDANQNCMFVTQDRDFYERGEGVILSPDLAEEAGGRVRLFDNLKDVLRSIESQLPHVEDEAIAKALTEAVLPEMELVASDQGWHAGHRIGSSVELFATECPNTTAAVFTLEFRVFGGEDLQGRSVDEGVAQVSGECMLSGDLRISKLALDRFDLYTVEGNRMKGGAVFAPGAIWTTGTPSVPYSVRAPLPRRPVQHPGTEDGI